MTREFLRSIGGKFTSESQAWNFSRKYKFAIRNVEELMTIGPKNFSNDFMNFSFTRKLTNVTSASTTEWVFFSMKASTADFR